MNKDHAVILWLDLGNTRLKYWLINNGDILAHEATEHLKAPNELLMGLLGTLTSYQPSFVGISSVLGDRINQGIADTLSALGLAYEFAQVNHQHPQMTSRYDPKQLGVDRWLQMLGAVTANQRQCVVGCGTALTIDIIEHGEHLGGYIMPNVYMQRHALYAGTQQIEVKQGKFDSMVLGVNTSDAVNHGVLFGIVGAVRQVQDKYPEHQLILTGGGAQMLADQLSGMMVDEALLLKGLQRYFVM